jgi:hypothetical protein
MMESLPFREPLQNAPSQPAQEQDFLMRNTPREEQLEVNDEWEYEYSTTETEVGNFTLIRSVSMLTLHLTYYLTLDLTSLPDTRIDRAKKAKKAPSDKKTWQNPGLSFFVDPVTGKHKSEERSTVVLEGESPPPTATHFEEYEDEEEQEFFDHTAQSQGRPKLGTSGKSQLMEDKDTEPEIPSAVQIMGLHTSQPFVSYGGKLYVCKWSSNIGTELLFTKRDEQNPLPSIRSLPDGVDLLAASSIRLTSNLVHVEPKAMSQYTMRGRSNKPPVSIVPPEKTAADREEDQLNFLESLRNIKRLKGEEDQVTMLLKKVPNGKFADQMRKERREEMSGLRWIIENSRDEVDVENAKNQLAGLEKQDKEELLAERKSGKQKAKSSPLDKRKRSPSGAPRMNNKRRLEMMEAAARAPISPVGMAEGINISQRSDQRDREAMRDPDTPMSSN